MSAQAFQLYPFPEGEPVSDLFQMTIDGETIPLHTARVSAFPINRRWPGHQRSLDQTEAAAFASFSMTAPCRVTVVPKSDFKEVVIRPLSRNITPEINGDSISFTLPEAGYYTVEFDGTHNALHLFADPELNFNIDRHDAGLIYFGPGCHDAGLIEMTERQTLFLDAGAVVYGRIQAKDANNIRILGQGILDASKVKEILREITEEDLEMQQKGFAMLNAKRFNTINLEFCDNVEIRGITIRDSLLYNIRPCGCRNIRIEHVKLIGNWRYNSDGIDLHNCENVLIRNCFIRTFDDSICIKGYDYSMDESQMLHNGVLYDKFFNVLVEKCVIWCDWGKSLEIGAETRASEIFNITFRDCDIIHYCDSLCDICNVDYADVHDVLFENIRAEYSLTQRPVIQKTEDQPFADDPLSDYTPPVITNEIIYIPEYSAGGIKRGRNRKISYRNIQVSAAAMPPCCFRGFDAEHLVEDITIDGIYLNGKRLDDVAEIPLLKYIFTRNIDFIK